MQYMAEIAAHEEAEEEEEHSDADEEEEDDEQEGEDDAEEAESTPAAADATEPPSLDTLSLADQPPHPPTSEPEHDEAANDDDDVSNSDSDAESDGSAAPSVADTLAHRRHRPSARRTAPDVAAIVTNKLAKNKASSERKHHGKKPQTSNVLGRNKGSKAKQSRTRAIKDGGEF